MSYLLKKSDKNLSIITGQCHYYQFEGRLMFNSFYEHLEENELFSIHQSVK